MLWEAHILYWIQEVVRHDWLNPIVIGITKLGDAGVFWLCSIVFFLFIKKERKTAIYALLSIVVCYVLTCVVLKNLVNRVRPYDAYSFLHILVAPEKDASFPSGHSSIAFSVAMIYYYSLSNHKLGIGFVVFAALIALSRLYVGVHYPSDVVAGIACGVLIAYGIKRMIMDKEKRVI